MPQGDQSCFLLRFEGSVNWLWSAARAKTHNWMSKILRLTLRVGIRTGGTWVEYRKRTSQATWTKWTKLNLPTMAETNSDHIWKAMSWAAYDGDVPVTRALRSILGWKTTTSWRTRNAWRMKVDTQTLQEGSTNLGFHSRWVLWDMLVTRWAGEENDRVQWMV